MALTTWEISGDPNYSPNRKRRKSISIQHMDHGVILGIVEADMAGFGESGCVNPGNPGDQVSVFKISDSGNSLNGGYVTFLSGPAFACSAAFPIQ
jgi:hypothetical protein